MSVSLRAEVEAKSLLGYKVALLHIDNVVTRLERDSDNLGHLMEAWLVRAEVLQKIGDIGCAESQLRRLDLNELGPLSRQGFLLIRAKLRTQAGDVRSGDAALRSLGDKLGHYSSSEIAKTHLWRQAFTQGLLGEGRRAMRLADEHRESVARGGFHEANNFIYTRLLPRISLETNVVSHWRSHVDDVREAGRMYLLSDVDLAGRLGNRGKSLCQALLAEAAVLWAIENRLAAYRVGFTAALLLKHWGLSSRSEGVGEMFGALSGAAVELVSVLRFVIDQDGHEPVGAALERLGASAGACAAFGDAASVVVEMLGEESLSRVYELLNEWS